MTLFLAGSKLRASDIGLIAAKYQRTTAQTGIAATTNTKISGYTGAYNVGGKITESSGVLTVAKDGLWHVAGNVEMVTETGDDTYAWVGHGSDTSAPNRWAMSDHSNRAGVDTFNMSADVFLPAGSTVAMWVWNDTSTQTIVDEMYAWIAVRYLGPLT
jgi:hypothetical protein